MRVEDTLRDAHQALEKRGIAHALIGGLAAIAHGDTRSNLDVDLLVDGARRAEAREAFVEAGYVIFHESDNVLQLSGNGSVDCIYAASPAARSMLRRARAIRLQGVPCVEIEDLASLARWKSLGHAEVQCEAEHERIVGPVDLRQRPPLPFDEALKALSDMIESFHLDPPPRERIEIREPHL